MDAVVSSSGYIESPIEKILASPQSFFPDFFTRNDSDLAMFVQDIHGKLTFLSESATRVCDLGFSRWRNKSLIPVLSDHPWNQSARIAFELPLKPNEIQVLKCEIVGDTGKRTLLEIRRQLIVFDELPIGVAGIAMRICDPLELLKKFSVLIDPSLSGAELLARWSSLSSIEVEVVEQVVGGVMNKMIAKNLGVAERTIEARRSRVMRKLGLSAVPDLVRFHFLIKLWNEMALLAPH